jgi:flagellar biosynthetic protein FlhB
MAEVGGQEKTEAPTQKKREDSRKQGQVALSREIPSAALLGAFLLYFLVMGRFGLEQMQKFWISSFQQLERPELNIPLLYQGLRDVIWVLGTAILALFLAVFLVGLATTLLQVGFHFNPLRLQGKRINPLSGLKRIFSYNGLAELLKGLFKMGIIGYITYVSINSEVLDLLSLSKLPLSDIFAYNFTLLATLFGRVAMALVVLALFDYLFQRWQFEQNLMMTKQELREELKQTEGDPQFRSRVRQVQRELSRARMMQNVPKADVVVTNPTHFAVALQYDREIMSAPKVTAKGADFIAERIRTVAKENDVPIVENPLVARQLYEQVEIGEEIPEALFRALAEILAYVYRLQGRTIEPSA